DGVASRGISRERDGSLQRQPRQSLGKLLRAEQRTAGRTGRDGGKGAPGERAQPVLQRERAGRREYSPLVEIAPRDLAERERLDDLGAVVARLLRFALAGR